jgi:arylmalonate decarboxylase
MYGTRAKIGLLVPSANTIIEEDFHALKPDGVSVHSARMFFSGPGPTEENLAAMAEDTEAATQRIMSARPDVIAFGCTTGSVLKGIGWDQELISRIEKVAKVPATTTATAVIRAMQHLNIKRISLGSPYNDALNEIEVDFFNKSGIEVTKVKGLDLTVKEMDEISLERVVELARDVNTPDAEAVFLSCTNLKSLPILDQAEKELGKYVFSSNIATFWETQRLLKIKTQYVKQGKLLETLNSL